MFQRPEVMVLRRDHVDVTVDAGGREDEVLARDGVGRRARDQVGVHAVHDVGVAGLADAGDLAVLDADVGLHHAQHGVDDRDVGDDQIERSLLRGHRVGQSHAVADGLSAAVYHFVAVFAQVLFDLDVEIGVAQADFVAHGRAEQVVVFLT